MLIRRLLAPDAAAFQTLRLAALRDSPTSFSSSYDEQRATPLAAIAALLEERNLFGAFQDGALAGMVGVGREQLPKLRHKATIRAMFVARDQRGKGVGKLLLAHAVNVAAAMDGVRQVTLDVTAGNAPAIGLYEAEGFTVYGCEPDAMLVDGTFHDTVLMVRVLAQR
jgi:ribosomal protein S18 acetylase RimI-like enzyme